MRVEKVGRAKSNGTSLLCKGSCQYIFVKENWHDSMQWMGRSEKSLGWDQHSTPGCLGVWYCWQSSNVWMGRWRVKSEVTGREWTWKGACTRVCRMNASKARGVKVVSGMTGSHRGIHLPNDLRQISYPCWTFFINVKNGWAEGGGW